MTSLQVLSGATSIGIAPGRYAQLAHELARERKIVRLLRPMSMPPFVVALTAFDKSDTNAAGTALFTVSGWDPWLVPALAVEGGEPTHLQRFKYMSEHQKPTEWLGSLANNPLCQIAIARGLRGPNMHIVGSACSVADVVVLVEGVLAGGEAEAALLVAFDPPPGEARAPANAAYSDAAALMIARRDAASVRLAPAGRERPGTRAVDLVTEWANAAAESQVCLDSNIPPIL